MGEKYQDSLDLFRQIYFNEDGTLKKDDFMESTNEPDSYTYSKLGKDYSLLGDGRSKIIGRSAFTPRIVREYVKRTKQNPDTVEGYRYFLTVDSQGKFDHHFELKDMYTQTEGVTGQEILTKYKFRNIDVTDMSQEEIMDKVSQMLNMSNEEIMTAFNISYTYSAKVKLELLVDDIAQKYFEEKGGTITESDYGPEWGMRAVSDIGRVEQSSTGYDERTPSKIKINPENDQFGLYEDEIWYKVLTPKEEDIDKIRIEFEDNRHTKVNSELGRLIYDTLKERFTDRQLEEEQTQEEQPVTQQVIGQKTGAEQILEFMQEKGLSPHDLSLALTMTLARESNMRDATQHLVQQAEKGQEEINKNEQNQE